MRSNPFLFILFLFFSSLSVAQSTSGLDTISPIRKTTLRATIDTTNAYGKTNMDSVKLIRQQFSFYADSSFISHFEISLFRLPDSIRVDSVNVIFRDSLFYTPFGNKFEINGLKTTIKSTNVRSENRLFGRIRLYFIDQTTSNDILF